MAKVRKDNLAPRIDNRKARHDFHIDEKLEVGIALQGSEVKSIRMGNVSLAEGFARVESSGELFLYNVDIGPYAQSRGNLGHEPKHPRKLLAHKREIAKLQHRTDAKGATLIPLAMYFVRGRVKVELGVARGKTSYDKRHDIKDRDAQREIHRGMTRRTIGD